MTTFINSEDPDEMQHSAAFHEDLHCYGKKILRPLDMYKGLTEDIISNQKE